MKREDIINCIEEYLGKSIMENDTLLDLGIDSIELISILVELENKFGFEVNDDNLNYTNYNCIKDVADITFDQIKKI